MDHAYIDEHNLADRYVLDTLTPEDRRRFEEHFVDCPECLDRVEHAERWRRGLKAAVAADAGKPPLFTRFPRLPVWRQLMVVAAGLVVIVGPLAFAWRAVSHAERQLTELRASAADWQRRYRELAGSRPAPTAPLPATLPVFPLSLTRGAPLDGGAPEARIDLQGAPPWVIFSLEVASDPAWLSYRASLAPAHGQVIWSAEGLRPSGADILALSLPSAVLQKGDYILTLEARTRSGALTPAGRYSFRVAK